MWKIKKPVYKLLCPVSWDRDGLGLGRFGKECLFSLVGRKIYNSLSPGLSRCVLPTLWQIFGWTEPTHMISPRFSRLELSYYVNQICQMSFLLLMWLYLVLFAFCLIFFLMKMDRIFFISILWVFSVAVEFKENLNLWNLSAV